MAEHNNAETFEEMNSFSSPKHRSKNQDISLFSITPQLDRLELDIEGQEDSFSSSKSSSCKQDLSTDFSSPDSLKHNDPEETEAKITLKCSSSRSRSSHRIKTPPSLTKPKSKNQPSSNVHRMMMRGSPTHHKPLKSKYIHRTSSLDALAPSYLAGYWPRDNTQQKSKENSFPNAILSTHSHYFQQGTCLSKDFDSIVMYGVGTQTPNDWNDIGELQEKRKGFKPDEISLKPLLPKSDAKKEMRRIRNQDQKRSNSPIHADHNANIPVNAAMTSVNRYKFSKSQSNSNSPFLGKSYSPPLQSHTIIINGKHQRHINGSSEALNKEVESICTYDVDGNPKCILGKTPPDGRRAPVPFTASYSSLFSSTQNVIHAASQKLLHVDLTSYNSSRRYNTCSSLSPKQQKPSATMSQTSSNHSRQSSSTSSTSTQTKELEEIKKISTSRITTPSSSNNSKTRSKTPSPSISKTSSPSPHNNEKQIYTRNTSPILPIFMQRRGPPDGAEASPEKTNQESGDKQQKSEIIYPKPRHSIGKKDVKQFSYDKHSGLLGRSSKNRTLSVASSGYSSCAQSIHSSSSQGSSYSNNTVSSSRTGNSSFSSYARKNQPLRATRGLEIKGNKFVMGAKENENKQGYIPKVSLKNYFRKSAVGAFQLPQPLTKSHTKQSASPSAAVATDYELGSFSAQMLYNSGSSPEDRNTTKLSDANKNVDGSSNNEAAALSNSEAVFNASVFTPIPEL